jgi:phosphatidylinositol dimannoside acyltransferase
MGVSLRTIINSKYGIFAAKTIGRLIPPFLGYPLVGLVGRWLAGRRNSDMVRAIRANQWVVHGGRLTAHELDELVYQAFQHVARCQYDLYHTLHKREAVDRMIVRRPAIDALVAEVAGGKKGHLIVSPHLSNFDMLVQAFAMWQPGALALVVPSPTGGYEMQNDIRRVAGLDIAPASMASIKEAVRRLKNGGTVLTGVDRPVPEPTHRPYFFGRPANLPMHYITLALAANVPVTVAVVMMNADGLYEVAIEEPLVMERLPDRHETMLHNAERVLELAAKHIRQAPHQWNMYFPVWPDVEQELPEE